MSFTFLWPFLFWLYVAATLFQLAVILGVFSKIPNPQSPIRNPQSPIRNPQSPIPIPISILLCARNEAANLRRHLPAILAQQYEGDWELLVVDDASEDESPVLLREWQQTHPRLRVLRVPEKKQPGKKQALALGIAAARYDCLLVTDADCCPSSPYWLVLMAAALTAKPGTEIVLGYGPLHPAPGFLNGWARFETAQTAIQYGSFAVAGMPYMGVGRNLAFKKKAYERAGGFAHHLDLASGDDDLLVNAAAHAGNTVVCLHPDTFMYSDAKKTWREWMLQKRRHLTAGHRYRRSHQWALAMLSLSHTLHYFLLPLLLWGRFGMVTVTLLLFARCCALLFLYGRLFPLLRESRLLSRIPIYDALLSAYYGAFVPISLMAPWRARSAWK